MTAQEREKIYREVKHEYTVEDAKYHVERFLDGVTDPALRLIDFDYEELANRFEESYECNSSENDQWESLIFWYIKQHKPEDYKLVRVRAFPHAMQDGTLAVPKDLTVSSDITQYVIDHWEEVAWNSPDLNFEGIPFRVDTPDGNGHTLWDTFR